jgi:hypothetical protein
MRGASASFSINVGWHRPGASIPRDANQCRLVKRPQQDTLRQNERQRRREHSGEPVDALIGVCAQRRDVKGIVAHAARDDANCGR